MDPVKDMAVAQKRTPPNKLLQMTTKTNTTYGIKWLIVKPLYN